MCGALPSLLVLCCAAASASGLEESNRSQAIGHVAEFEHELADRAKQGRQDAPGGGSDRAPPPAGAWTVMPQGHLTPFPDLGFVSYKSYRRSASRIVILGLLKSMQGLPVDLNSDSSCEWVDRTTGKRTRGALSYEVADEHHYKQFDTAMIFCDVEGADATTDATWQQHTDKPQDRAQSLPPGVRWATDVIFPWLRGSPAREIPAGGHMEVRLGKVHLVAHVERGMQVKVHGDASQGPFEHDLVFCGPPIFGRLWRRSIGQWVDYHLFHAGYQHLFLYDAGVEGFDLTKELRRFLDAGLLTLVDWTQQEEFETWAHAQGLAMQECLYRNAHTAAWVAYGDLDEYVHVMLPQGLPGFLRAQLLEKPDRAWFSHGAFFFQHHCEVATTPPGEQQQQQGQAGLEAGQDENSPSARVLTDAQVWGPEQHQFAVELVPYRPKLPFCWEHRSPDPAYCHSFPGHRKLIVNPRKVEVMNVHCVRDGAAGRSIPGAVLSAWEDLRHGHYSGLTGSANEWCMPPGPMESTSPDDPIVEDLSIAHIASLARECAQRRTVPTHMCA